MVESHVPKACYLTGQFLSFFESNKGRPHFTEVFDAFLDELPPPRMEPFPLFNCATVVMLCYALVAYPGEYWDIKNNENLINELEKEIVSEAKEMGDAISTASELFGSEHSSLPTRELLRRLRNAISHARIGITESPTIFRFTDVYQGEVVFECSISDRRLLCFLTAVGRFFANHQVNIR